MSYSFATFLSLSPRIGKFIFVCCVSSISPTHFLCDGTSSTLTPIALMLRLSNSLLSLATVPSSVVQTGVKSLGCENRIAHPSPIHSWKWIVPCVVSAVKSGAVSLIRRDIAAPIGIRPHWIEKDSISPRPDAENGRQVLQVPPY